MERRMRRWGLGLMLAAGVAALAGCGADQTGAAAGAGYTVVDAAGTEVRIPKKPAKILADSQFLDTMALGIVPADHLAAVSAASKDPAISYIAGEVKDIQMTIPLAAGISAEELTAARPDLVLCSTYSSPKQVEMYRSLGFPVVIVKGPVTVGEVKDGVRLVAAALGEADRGEKVVAEMDRHLDHAEAVLSALDKPRPTALLISQMTRYGGPGSMYHELLTRAHIENAMEKVGVANGQLMPMEKMIESDPDFLFVSKDRAIDETGAGEYRDSVLASPAIRRMRAYRHIIPLEDRYIYSSTQNCVYAVEAMANAAYGPLFDLSEEPNIKGY